MKWIGWLAKWAAGAVLASALSVLTTCWMVESYVNALLERWNLGGAAPELAVGELVSSFLPGNDRKAAGSAPKADAPAAAGESPADAENRGEAGTGAPRQANGAGGTVPGGAAPSAKRTPAEETAPPPGAADAGTGPRTGESTDVSGAIPVFGRAALQSGLVMSAEEFNEKRKSLSDSDKAEIFTMLYNHVPQEELQRLSGLVEDGITAEEARQIADVMEGYLEPADMERLLTILFDE